MPKLSVNMLDEHPNLSSLGISGGVLEQYRVFKARTSLGQRIAIPYAEDCT